MMQVVPRFVGAVFLSLVVAVVLTIIPLSERLAIWRPEWVALTFFYWGLTLGPRVNLWLALFFGLILDVLHGSMLGHHAMELVMVAYFSVRLGLRLKPEAYFQQFFLIVVILGGYMLVNRLILGMTGLQGMVEGVQYWAPLLSSMMIWPLYQWLLSFFSIPKKSG